MRKLIKILGPLVAIGALILMILWLGGFLTPGQVGPGTVEYQPDRPDIVSEVQAKRITVPLVEEAVGTLRPETEANISAQTTGRVLTITVRAGDEVKKGQLLIQLDASELQSRVDQAKQQEEGARAKTRQAREALNAAQAQLQQAESQYERIEKFHEQEAATTQQLEEATSAYRQAQAAVEQAKEQIQAAEADVARAREAVREAQVALGYATIHAPISGEISKRLAEPGDLAFPGKTLLSVQSEGALQLEANVRESLISEVPLGASVEVEIPSVKKRVSGTVDEIVPSADAASRTFLVKVQLASIERLYPGMFGKLLIPAGTRETIVVPPESIQGVGQLKMVYVQQDDRWERRYVRTGGEHQGDIEILSGLSGGERLGIVRRKVA